MEYSCDSIQSSSFATFWSRQLEQTRTEARDAEARAGRAREELRVAQDGLSNSRSELQAEAARVQAEFEKLAERETECASKLKAAENFLLSAASVEEYTLGEIQRRCDADSRFRASLETLLHA